MAGPDPRAGNAGMAGGRALQDAGSAPPEHRGAAADDAGRADRPLLGRMAGAADQGRRAVRTGADAWTNDPPPAYRGAGVNRGIRAPEGRASAPGAQRGALFRDPGDDQSTRAVPRRAHGRGAGRARLFAGRDRRIARDGCTELASRHCERSEAISRWTHPDRDCFVASLLAMT